MELTERKRRFMFQMLMEPDQPYKAGLAAFPERENYYTNMAFKVAEEWLNDEECLIIKKQLEEEHGPAFFLPSKADVAREIFTTAKNAKTAADKLRGFELYANLMSFIEKPPVAQINNTNNQTTNKVMVVPKSNTDEDWETKLLEQQTLLVSAA